MRDGCNRGWPVTLEFATPIHVVAGVLVDTRGRILLARRTAGRDLAGAWEFPGGKLEPGETPFEALERELHEELGIRVHAVEPLISVPQAYPGKRIVLDVYRVLRFTGTPRSREKQALAWVPSEKLGSCAMPPADRPVVAALNESAVYLVTPEPCETPARFLTQLETALASGQRLVQLRVKTLYGDALRDLASRVLQSCRQYDASLLINGQIELAATLGCGLHLTAAQLMAVTARPLPIAQKVAASCHTFSELRHAQAIGLDFVVLGPVSITPSHPGQPGIGWSELARLREQVSLPIYAIGGMTSADIGTARRHGAQGVAGIGSFWPTQT